MGRVVQFFKDSAAEVRRIVWPSRDSVIASTKVVVVSTLIIAFLLAVVDYLFITILGLLF